MVPSETNTSRVDSDPTTFISVPQALGLPFVQSPTRLRLEEYNEKPLCSVSLGMGSLNKFHRYNHKRTLSLTSLASIVKKEGTIFNERRPTLFYPMGTKATSILIKVVKCPQTICSPPNKGHRPHWGHGNRGLEPEFGNPSLSSVSSLTFFHIFRCQTTSSSPFLPLVKSKDLVGSEESTLKLDRYWDYSTGKRSV